jgi:4'-phosphopantetheinyl transferase EntD
VNEQGLDAVGIAQLFARPVAVGVAAASMYDQPPFAEEALVVARAVEPRRREFAAGRACARLALAELGFAPAAIAIGPDRAPVWPADAVGSITHCEGFCCAVAARKGAVAGLGIDAEAAEPLEPASLRLVLRAEERAAHAPLPGIAGLDWPKLAFSAKEAFYKAWRPLTGLDLTFQDVAIDFCVDGSFQVRLAPSPTLHTAATPWAFTGRWRLFAGRVCTGVTALPV